MLIISIIIFLLTLFVHKNTVSVQHVGYGEVGYTKLRTPLWAVIIVGLISLIPIFNIIAFIVGAIFRILAQCINEVAIAPDTRLGKSIKAFITILNKDI